MKKNITALALLAGVLAGPAAADTVGIYAGIGQWQNSFSGDLLKEQVSVKNDLGLKHADLTQWYVNLEHPLPVLPNVRLAYANVNEQGSGQINQSVRYDGITYPSGATVNSDIAIKMTDVTFYYELWDTGGDFDVGLTGRRLNGHLALSNDQLGRGQEKVDDWVPMLYLNGRVDLPMTGLYVGAQGNGVAYSGNRLADYRAFVGYDFDITGPVDVGLQFGYRRLDLKLKDIGSFEGNVKLDGAFANVTMHF